MERGPELRRSGLEPLPRDRYARNRFGSDRHGAPGDGGPDLKALLRQLSQDVTQLVDDELTLAKMEIRDVAEAFSSDLQAAGQTVVKDMAKVGVALVLALLAGLALTAGLILGIGRLLGDAFWAGGLIVGVIYLIAAAVFGASAAKDLRDSEALRLEHGRRTLERDKAVLRDEAQDTARFAKEEAQEFKRHASPPEKAGSAR